MKNEVNVEMYKNKLCELTPNRLVEANQIIIVGDIHGDYDSFKKARSLFNPTQDYIIFLGDYADRGENGIEVIESLRSLIKKYPLRVIALKGNHEDYTQSGEPQFEPCSLIDEAYRKRGGWKNFFENEFRLFVSNLYLAVLIPEEVLFVHGGVSRRVGSIEDLKYPSRLIEKDVLWSDPYEGEGEDTNLRGIGVIFGKDVSKEICDKIGVKRIVRSHQPRKASKEPCVEHDGRVITISSTHVYTDKAFALKLPAYNLDDAFQNLEKYVEYL
jgi:3',5'-cyclic AMP phosphodiesterase CpdA